MQRSASSCFIEKATIKVAVIADDLTGAADTAIHFLHDKGQMLILDLAGKVPVDFNFADTIDAITINTASRGLKQEVAVEKIRYAADMLNSFSVPLVYKKIDSQLRGLPGLEIETLRDNLGLRCAFIAPAYPSMGRKTSGGVHFVNDLPVHQSEAGRDPVTPVCSSNISELIKAQAGVKTGHIYYWHMAKGTKSLCYAIERMLADGVRAITFDATTQHQLELIAEAGLRSFDGVLLAGSAGLAISVAKIMGLNKSLDYDDIPSGQSLLFVCGSASEISQQQADRLITNGCCREVRITLRCLTKEDAWKKLVRDAMERWRQGDLLIRFSRQTIPVDVIGVPERLNRISCLVSQLTALKKPDGLFLSGGDTAGIVLNRMQTGGVKLKLQVMPGMALGRAECGLLNQVTVVLKSGAFGSGGDLLKLYRMWKKESSENDLQ